MSWQSRILAAARGAALLALLVAGLGAPRPTGAAPLAAGPDLGAEALSYGVDQIPDPQKPELRVRNFYTRTVADATAKQITTLGNVWYQNWAPDGKQIAIVTEG